MWRAAMSRAIADIRATAPKAIGAVNAIGFSGQMHGVVALDQSDRPVRQAILHNDGRAHAEAIELDRDYPQLTGIVGVKPMPGFTGPKLLWLSRHEPERRRQIDCVLAPKDYLRLALCGERGTDMSDAAGTWLLDEGTRTWSTEAIAACSADPAWVPPLFEGSSPVGKNSPRSCRGVRATARRGDRRRRRRRGCGRGRSRSDRTGPSLHLLGTATQLIVPTDRYISPPDKLVHSFAHSLPGRWYAMAAMLNGAGVLAFAGQLLGETRSPPACGGRWLPRTRRSRFPSISLRRAHPARRSLRARRAVRHERGDDPGRRSSRSDGGRRRWRRGRARLSPCCGRGDRACCSSRKKISALWTRMIAAATGFTIVRMQGGEAGPALGAARLARIAAAGEPAEAVRAASRKLPT